MKRMRSSKQQLIFGILLAGGLLLSSCQENKVIDPTLPSPSATEETTFISPTATLPQKIQDFPLFGSWLGPLQKGDQRIGFWMEINRSCELGKECGSFTLIEVPCSDTIILTGEKQGAYEFQVGSEQGTCSNGSFTLTVNPDETIQVIKKGDLEGYVAVLDRVNPVIFDDDGSSDGTIALMYLLSDPRVSLKAITFSHGVGNPQNYAKYVAGLLDSMSVTGIPIGAGENKALHGLNEFPDEIRQQADTFWGMPILEPNTNTQIFDAATLIVSTLNEAPEPYTILVTGPCTNLAKALLLDPGIKKNIKSVVIMGGAVFTHGNLDTLTETPANLSAEWNIFIDPKAASLVLNSGLDIILVPIDGSNKLFVTSKDASQWSQGGPKGIFASDLYNVLIKNSSSSKLTARDLDAAVVMIKPILCEFKDVAIKVITDGKTIGQTNVLQGSPPNAHVCLDPVVVEITKMFDFMLSRNQ